MDILEQLRTLKGLFEQEREIRVALGHEDESEQAAACMNLLDFLMKGYQPDSPFQWAIDEMKEVLTDLNAPTEGPGPLGGSPP